MDFQATVGKRAFGQAGMMTPKAGPQWLRFGLRLLLLFHPVIDFALGKVDAVRDQQRAVAEITRIGGAAVYDFELDGHSKRPLLEDLLGKDCFGHVRVVGYNGSDRFTDEILADLRSLPDLGYLYIENVKVTDDGLRHLQGLTSLKWLSLRYTTISDDGLRHLEGLRNLKQIELYKTKVTDVGRARLQAALPGCKIWLTQKPTP